MTGKVVMKNHRPVFWRLFFLVLSLAYLVPEMIFNAQLVSLVGLGTPDDRDLERLEIYGRAVSGIGVSLLIADLLPARFYASVMRAVLSIAVVFCVTWPSVYFGQKYLIEEFLIKSSTADERAHAVLSAAMRDALAKGGIEVTDLLYDREQLEAPENLTFLALFGGLVYANGNLVESVNGQVQAIIKRTAQMDAYDNFDQDYKKFGKLYDRLSSDYKTYVEGSNKYNRTLATIGEREQEYWRQVEQEVNGGWSKYQEAQKAYIARAEGRAQKYGPKIYDYFDDTQRCNRRYKKSSQQDSLAKCLNKLNARYTAEIKQLGLGYIEPDYWLIIEKVSAPKKSVGTLVSGLLSGGKYTAMQALDMVTGGGSDAPSEIYKYTKNPAHYQERILAHPNFSSQFEKETGYPYGISNLIEFRAHPQTQEKLRSSLKTKGLSLSSSWNISQRGDFARAVASKVKLDAESKWKTEVSKSGIQLQPNLSWQAFQLHSEIQKKIKQEMGDNYVSGTRADWGEQEFKKNIVDPSVDRKVKDILSKIDGAVARFADGGEYEEDGKRALRSVVVPPISMALSLFLICMTILKMPLKTMDAINPNWKQVLPRWGFIVLTVSLPVILLVAPVLLSENRYTKAANSPVNFFLTKVEESATPAISYVLRWTLHAQPFLHPLGRQLEERVGLYNSNLVSEGTHVLAEYDEHVLNTQNNNIK